MIRRCGSWKTVYAPWLRGVAIALCLSSSAGAACAQSVEGAWELVAYELEGSDVPVSGVLVFGDRDFGMIYTMRERFGRAHAGTYEVREGQVHFDVELWLQKTEASTGFVPGTSVAAAMEWHAEGLTLRFDGGSVQKLRRIESSDSTLPGGRWIPQPERAATAEAPARAALVTSGDRFVLLSLDEATREGHAYGGTLGPAGRADPDWAVSVDHDSGTALAGDAIPALSYAVAGSSVTFSGQGGPVATFGRR